MLSLAFSFRELRLPTPLTLVALPPGGFNLSPPSPAAVFPSILELLLPLPEAAYNINKLL